MSASTVARARELAGYDEVSALRQAQDLDWVLDLAPSAPRSVLDLGCGTGALLDRARRRWPRATLAGIDGAEGRVGEARARLGPAADVRRGDLRHLGGVAAASPRDGGTAADPEPAAAGDAVDLITSTSVLHWLYPDEPALLRWVAEHLTTDGAFVLTTHHPHVRADGLGAEDVVALDALAALGVSGFGDVVPMARRARPVADVAALLAAHLTVDHVEQREVPVRTTSAGEYARFHASTFGTYFSRRAPEERQEAFFAAVGDAAWARQADEGAVYPITVRAWRARRRAPAPRAPDAAAAPGPAGSPGAS